VVVDRHPQIGIFPGETEIAFDQGPDPVAARRFQPRPEMIGPEPEGAGVDRQDEPIRLATSRAEKRAKPISASCRCPSRMIIRSSSARLWSDRLPMDRALPKKMNTVYYFN
jgi:hypothetical protein